MKNLRLARRILAERIALRRTPNKPPGKGLFALLGPG